MMDSVLRFGFHEIITALTIRNNLLITFATTKLNPLYFYHIMSFLLDNYNADVTFTKTNATTNYKVTYD